MSNPEDRSGSSPEWVNSLGDITPDDCRAYIASLMDTPIKGCDTPNCDQVAIYRVSFHGCTRFTVCGMHRAVWAAGVAQAIQYNGSIVCEVCNQFTYSLESTMQWFAI